jgi:acyl carrier protein
VTIPAPAEIQQFISDTFLNGRSIMPDEDLLLSGLLDSLGVMTLVSFIEKQTGQKIPAQDITLENFTSVDTITAYLNGASV